MPLKSILCILLASCAHLLTLRAETNAQHAVAASSLALNDPPRLVLQWPARADATEYKIFRRLPGSTSWPLPIHEITSDAAPNTGWTDFSVAAGTIYEYRIMCTTTSAAIVAYSHLWAGLDAPIVESRGSLILCIDRTIRGGIAPELKRYEMDLIGDGWKIHKHYVPRALVGQPGWKEAVVATRQLILNTVAADSDVRGVVLIGHVPVPYSGRFVAPDGHPDHSGAWPADLYYGDLDATWEDEGVSIGATRPENQNAAGDGKFDSGGIPTTNGVELMIGRIDLSRMPAFGLSETALLKRYFDKNHNFRHGATISQRRGLIDANFGPQLSGKISATAHRSFSALFGADQVVEADLLTTLASQSYLMAYGDGGGTYTSSVGVANTNQFAAAAPHAVFFSLFGSYFGDWDNENNLLRAPLAAAGHGLTSAWNGRPYWNYHPMGMGAPIGLVAREAQNNEPFLNYQSPSSTGVRGIHIALMGDPALRLHPFPPPRDLQITGSGPSTTLTWQPSTDASVSGYHIYRAASQNGPYTRVTGVPATASIPDGQPIVATNFIDATLGANLGAFYQVRAVKREISSTGSYYQMSQGIFSNNLPADLPQIEPGQYAAGDEQKPFYFRVLIDGTFSSIAQVSGQLPPGLSLNFTTGEITGTPLIAGIYEFELQANGPAGMGGSESILLEILSLPFLVVHEQFDYPAGSQSLANRNGGTGWSSTWGTALNDVAASDMSYQTPPHLLKTSGLSASIRNNVASFRNLPATYDNGTIWLSAILRMSHASGGWGGLSLFDGGGERLFVGQRNGSSVWGMERAGSGTINSLTPTSETAFVVLKLVLSQGPDDVFLWINPSLVNEPSEATAFKLENTSDFQFNRIRLMHGKGSGRTMTVDEIRLARSFFEIAPTQNPLAAFRALHGLAMDGSEDLQSPASDDVANLTKFAFHMIGSNSGQRESLPMPNRNPITPGRLGGLPIIEHQPSSNNFTLRFAKRKDAAEIGLIYQLEKSNDLTPTNWQEITISESSRQPLDALYDIIEANIPSSGSAEFLRMKITAPNP